MQQIPSQRPDHDDRRISRTPRWVRVGRGTFPFTSYPEVSFAYLATTEGLGLGISQSPKCLVLDEQEEPVAHVAYNGRVFAVGAAGEPDYSMVLHEP